MRVPMSSETTIFKRVKLTKEGITKTNDIEEERDNHIDTHKILSAEKDGVEAAIELYNNPAESVKSLKGVPKLFLGFPLLGSTDFPYPAVVNSKEFVSTPERDGIYLGTEDTDDIRKNKELITNANSLVFELISKLQSDRVVNTYDLLNLGNLPTKEWLDNEWLREQLLNPLINRILAIPMIKTEDENLISFEESLIPNVTDSNIEQIGALWKLFSRLIEFAKRLPSEDTTNQWSLVLSNWKSIGIIERPEIELTIDRLVKEIENSGTIGNLKAKLKDAENTIQTINDFYGLLTAMNKEEFFQSHNLLLNQNGKFAGKELFDDSGIDEHLKDIANLSGYDIREKLIDTRIDSGIRSKFSEKPQKELLDATIGKLTIFKDENFDANALMLEWLVDHDKREMLNGYPIKTLKSLKRLGGGDNDMKLLAPVKVWKGALQEFEDLFPGEYIISPKYTEKLTKSEIWLKLRDYGLILDDALYSEYRELNRKELSTLLQSNEELGEGDHKSASVMVSNIAFIDSPQDKSMIDTVRKSNEKALKFLKFLFTYVISTDKSWMSPIEVNCSCKSNHSIMPSIWIERLRNREWVPTRDRGEDKPSALSLADVISKDQEMLNKCTEELPTMLLNVLNVSVSELVMNVLAKDKHTRTELDRAIISLFSTFRSSPEKLSKVAELAVYDQELFMQEIEERLKIKEQVRKNQEIGVHIQNLLMEALKMGGFRVEPTGVGSDFEVENDYVSGDEERVLTIEKEGASKLFVEVKSTVSDYVNMTRKQAKDARDSPDSHILAVVRMDGPSIDKTTVRNSVSFVLDIGRKISNKVKEAEELQSSQEKAMSPGDIQIILNRDQMKFRINKQVWEVGLDFENFLLYLTR